ARSQRPRALSAGSARCLYVSRGVSPPARQKRKRPRSLTASVAASTIRWAAASASVAGSAHTVRLVSDAMVKSYPLVEAPLPLDRIAEARVMSTVGRERFPECLPGGGEIRQNAECLESEQCGAAARRLRLRRPRHGMAEGVGDDLGPRPRAAQRAAGSDHGVIGGRERDQEALDHCPPPRHSPAGRA